MRLPGSPWRGLETAQPEFQPEVKPEVKPEMTVTKYSSTRPGACTMRFSAHLDSGLDVRFTKFASYIKILSIELQKVTRYY